MTAATNSTPILEARGLTRSFGAVRALDNADFDVHRGEVVALIGDNGAGKSTMVKALSGNLALDSGTILFEGREVEVGSPSAASQMGIETVFQDLALAPHLNPPQNMFLGRELPATGILGKFGFMDNKTMRVRSKEAFDDLGATVRSYSDPVGSMSGGQRQAIAIARAVAWAKGVIFLDVRDLQEVNLGKIPNAVHISRGNLETKIEAAVPRNAEVVIYCASGNR